MISDMIYINLVAGWYVLSDQPNPIVVRKHSKVIGSVDVTEFTDEFLDYYAQYALEHKLPMYIGENKAFDLRCKQARTRARKYYKALHKAKSVTRNGHKAKDTVSTADDTC